MQVRASNPGRLKPFLVRSEFRCQRCQPLLRTAGVTHGDRSCHCGSDTRCNTHQAFIKQGQRWPVSSTALRADDGLRAVAAGAFPGIRRTNALRGTRYCPFQIGVQVSERIKLMKTFANGMVKSPEMGRGLDCLYTHEEPARVQTTPAGNFFAALVLKHLRFEESHSRKGHDIHVVSGHQ